MRSLRLLFGAIVGAVALSGSGCAGDVAAPIGRVSAVAGAVQYQPDRGDWSDALVNEPVGAGTGVRSGRAAQTELRIAGDRIALAGASELRIVRLDHDMLQVAVPQGRIGVHLDKTGAAKTVEIDLPQGGVWLAAPGDYDITAGDAQASPRIAVFAGSVQLGGGLTDSSFVVAAADTFSEWWRGQSRGDAAAAANYLSPAIAGAETLAANGSWESDDTYGDVWYPNGVAEDWAPYRDGSWRFLPPWGWTWIDDAAWGFAPSHYGRWARINARWAWVPGPRAGHAAYSPAMVAFLGTAGVGLSRPGEAGAAVAWFPLAPDEVPDDPDAHYQNRLFASIVPRPVFTSGKPVQPGLIQLPDQRLQDAPIILGDLGIAPAAVAVAAAPRKVSPAKPMLVVAALPQRPASSPVVQEKARKAFLSRIHDALVTARKKAMEASSARHARTALAGAPRPRSAPSTLPPHSAHNREHLAAARGGAEQ